MIQIGGRDELGEPSRYKTFWCDFCKRVEAELSHATGVERTDDNTHNSSSTVLPLVGDAEQA